MRNNLFLGVAAIALIAPAAVSAQETTATLRGSVTSQGAAVGGATVTITDTRTNNVQTLTTDAAGAFQQTGLNPGGPYTVQVTSDRGNTQVTDINTVVGAYDLPIELNATDTAAAEGTGADIVVTASSIRGAGAALTGPRTVLTQEDIRKVASVNRDVRRDDRRARDGRAVGGHRAPNRRGRLLRHRGHGNHERDGCRAQKELMSHVIFPPREGMYGRGRCRCRALQGFYVG